MEKNKNLEVGIRITSLFLTAVTIVVTTGCSLKKNKKSDDAIYTTTSISATENFEEKEEPTIKEVKEESDPVYNELLSKLEKNTKQFDEPTQESLKDLLKIMYSNSKCVDEVLPLVGFPDSKTILEERFIEPLGEIKSIITKTSDDDDYYDYIDKYGNSHYDKENKKIYILCDEKEQAQVLAEEIFHSSQKYEDNFVNYPEYCLFGEGEANILSWALVYGCINNSPAYYFYEDKDEFLTNTAYGVGNGYYALASKYYMYLSTLVGNDTLKEYTKTMDSKIIVDKLNKNYGIDGEKFYNNIIEIMADGCEYINDKKTEQFISCEKTYLKCMEQKAKKVNNKADLEKLLEVYRYLNIQFGYEYLIYDADGNFVDKTKEKIGTDKNNVEDILFEKAQDYGVLSISNDRKESRNIFNALINPPKSREENIYPIGILSSKINCNKGVLTVSNKDSCSYTHNLSTNKTTRAKNQDNSINEIDFKLENKNTSAKIKF